MMLFSLYWIFIFGILKSIQWIQNIQKHFENVVPYIFWTTFNQKHILSQLLEELWKWLIFWQIFNTNLNIIMSVAKIIENNFFNSKYFENKHKWSNCLGGQMWLLMPNLNPTSMIRWVVVLLGSNELFWSLFQRVFSLSIHNKNKRWQPIPPKKELEERQE
jgi:hypothetical protein